MSLRTRNVISVIVLALLSVAIVAGAYRVLFPPKGDGYIVYAEFKDSGGLTKNSDVKIGGVTGGKIVEIDLTKRDTALVKMDMKKGGHPIGAGAIAASRPVNLLGEKYIDMKAGDLSKPQKSGTRIPIARTSRPTELDDVLNILEPDVRARMRIMINEAGVSMMGRSADFNRVLDRLPAGLDETAELVAGFSADNRRLRAAIEQSDRVLSSIAGSKRQLQNFVASADDALEITTEKRRELAATLQQTPSAMRQLRTSLTTLQGASQQLEPAAVDLRRATPSLASALRRLPDFTDDAQPALASLKKTAPALTRLGTQARPTIRRLRPTARELDTFAKRATPLMAAMDRGSFKKLLNVMAGWASSTHRADGLGHVFRLGAIFDDEVITSALQRYGIDTPEQPHQRPNERSARDKDQPRVRENAPAPTTDAPDAPKPAETQAPAKPQAPGLQNTVDQTLKGVDDTLRGLDQTLRGVRGGLTGASQRSSGETQKLLDYLFGG